MNTEIAAFAREHKLFPQNGLVLCAVSGGADSVSMLHILHTGRERLGIRIAAAHYNHGIRPGAGRDEQFVRGLCAEWGIPFYSGRGDVPAEAAAGESLELAARRMRYAFLEETADAIGAAVIATAHTADDNMETVLMNLSRGTGAAGAAGIPPRRGRIVRPLLPVTRAQVEDYLRRNGLPHVEDETNREDCCSRNRVRHQAVPVLKQINPRAAEHIQAASERLRADNELLEKLAREQLIDTALRTPQGVSLEIGRLTRAPEPLAARCILALCREQGGEELSAAKVRAVLELARSENVSGELHPGGPLLVWRSYDRLWFGPERTWSFAPRPLVPDGTTYLPELDLTISCQTVEAGGKVHNSFLFYPIGCGTIRGNLVVRPRRTGDAIRLPGRPEKSLKKLFAEQKIPRRQREAVPVIADDAGVAAVVGVGCDVRRLAASGPVLEIQVQYGGKGR